MLSRLAEYQIVGGISSYDSPNPKHNVRYELEIRNWLMFERFYRFFYQHNPSIYLERKRLRFEKYIVDGSAKPR